MDSASTAPVSIELNEQNDKPQVQDMSAKNADNAQHIDSVDKQLTTSMAIASKKVEPSLTDCFPAQSIAKADDKMKSVTRFSAKLNGYLHIDDAEILLIIEHFQKKNGEPLILIIEDSNPSKENEELEKVILEDLEMLQIKYDRVVHTSDHFELIGTYCEQLLRQGKTYVDDTDPETMKREREQKLESKNRINSVDENLALWEEMKNGTYLGKRCCVRAKICMNHYYLSLKDPVMYRCNPEPHNRTGFKYKVYPTHDFACPIVDSEEGISYACRLQSESYDFYRQYEWFIEALGIRKPYISTRFGTMPVSLLSKRIVNCFAQKGIIDSWDDPRFPTVRGLLRRGLTAEALKSMVAEWASHYGKLMKWNKIWNFNRNFINTDFVPRFAALERNSAALVHIQHAEEVKTSVLFNIKKPRNGFKVVWLSDRVLVDLADIEALEPGDNVIYFRNWENKMKILKIYRGSEGVRVEAQLDWKWDPNNYEECKKMRFTQILNWLAVTEKAKPVPCICVYFDHQIITKLGYRFEATDEALEQYVNQRKKTEVMMLGELALANVNKGDIIQLHKRGFFICDEPYKPMSSEDYPESPIILFYIPDGSKATSSSSLRN